MTKHCPICHGTGEPPAELRNLSDRDARIVMARALRAKKYTWRDIARLCGWKSQRSAVDAVHGRPARSNKT